MQWEESLSEYGRILLELIKEYSGLTNAHAHLDRGYTLAPEYWKGASIDPFEAATFSLAVKQNLTGELHKGPAYTRENLEMRMEQQLRRMAVFQVKSVTSLIDATTDIGMVAIDAALAVKERMRDTISLTIGTQPIFGFKNPAVNPDRWELFVEASKKVDVVGALPEKDEGPGRIGYDEHLRRVIQLGIELGKEVHVHVDQANDPGERGTEKLVEAVHWIGSPKIAGASGPTVWAVHAISPSGYDEQRRRKLWEHMKRYDVGVIGCARAALSMRQLRPVMAPTHNSVGSLLEMAKHEIAIRLGTDNIADVFIPTGDENMLHELCYWSDALRYYVPKFWAKLGCGVPLNDMDREIVARALYQDNKVFRTISSDFPKI